MTLFYCANDLSVYLPALNVSSEHIWSPPQEAKEKLAENLGGKTALELMKQEQAQNGIVTFSAQIDEMLGKGILYCVKLSGRKILSLLSTNCLCLSHLASGNMSGLSVIN